MWRIGKNIVEKPKQQTEVYLTGTFLFTFLIKKLYIFSPLIYKFIQNFTDNETYVTGER